MMCFPSSKTDDSGIFGDDGQHAAQQSYTAISYEREIERPGVWIP